MEADTRQDAAVTVDGESPAAQATPRAGGTPRPRARTRSRLRRIGRLGSRVLRHPRYALSVLVTLLRRPRLLLLSMRRGWRHALLAECAALCPEVAGLISPYEAGFFGQVFLFDEYEVRRLNLPAAPVVCDVGANVGFFSWRVAALRPAATLLAFEPASANLTRLRRAFSALHIGGEVCAKACGGTAGKAVLYLRNSVTHSLDPRWHKDLDAGAGSEEVEITTLDIACDRRGLGHLDLLKIDTEGAEVDVLEGARAMLGHTRHIVLEYHSAAARTECRRILEGAGFRCREKSFWGLAPAGTEEGLLLCTRPSPG